MLFGSDEAILIEVTGANFILYIANMRNLFTISNKVKIILESENWEKKEYEYPNITCLKGRSSIARRLVDNTTADLWFAKYIAIGDSVIPAAESDIALWNEIQRQPIKVADTVLTDNVVKVYARFPIGFAWTFNEAWLFLDSTATGINGSGSLLAHSIFAVPVVKLTTEVLTIERTVSVVNVII